MTENRRCRATWRAAALLALAAGIAVAGCKTRKTEYQYDAGPHWPKRTVFPGVGTGAIVATNSYEDTLSFVDTSSLAPIATIPVGLSPVELEGPHHVVASPDGQFLYFALSETVPNSGSGPHGSHGSGAVPGYILKMSAIDATIVGQVRVDRNPGDLIISPDGATLYVSHFDVKRALDVATAGTGDPDSGIAVVDTNTMTMTALVKVCPAEHGLTFSPDHTKIYMACYGSDQLAIVDITQPSLPFTLVDIGPNPGTIGNNDLKYAPYAVTVTADGKRVWTSNWTSGDLRAFSTTSGTMTTTITVGGQPAFGRALGSSVVIARQSGDPGLPSDHLLVVDSSGTLAHDWVLSGADCVNAHLADTIPGKPGKVLMVCEGNHVSAGTMVQVDPATGTVEKKATLGVFPDAAAFVGGS